MSQESTSVLDDTLFLPVAACSVVFTVVHVICLIGLFHEGLHNNFVCGLFFTAVRDKKKLFCILTLWGVFINIAEGICLLALSHRSDLDQNLLIFFFTVIGEWTSFSLRRATACCWLFHNILAQYIFLVVVVDVFVESTPVNALLFGALGVNEVLIAFAVMCGIGPNWNQSQSRPSQSNPPLNKYYVAVVELVSSTLSALFFAFLTSQYHPDSIARTDFMEAVISILGFTFSSIYMMLLQSPFVEARDDDPTFPHQLLLGTYAVLLASYAVMYSLTFWRTLEDIDHPPDFDIYFSGALALGSLGGYISCLHAYKWTPASFVREQIAPLPIGRAVEA